MIHFGKITISGKDFHGDIEINIDVIGDTIEGTVGKPVEKIHLTDYNFDPERGYQASPATAQILEALDKYSGYEDSGELPFAIEIESPGSAAALFFDFKWLRVEPVIIGWEKITNVDFLYAQCHNLEKVTAPDLKNLNSTRGMYYQCRSLKEVGKIDMSTISDASGMFFDCLNLYDNGVRLVNKRDDVITDKMIKWSNLTREPWFDQYGNTQD